MKTVGIIGGGIHGMTSAIALAEVGFKVYVIEKNNDILQGTSGSTHNRAHVGYHYPRSIVTAEECFLGLQKFQGKYREALSYPKDVYYLIAKDSGTTVEFFKMFCELMKFPYEITLPSDEFINKDLIENGFKVNEPVFNLFKLKDIFEKKIKELNITVYKSAYFSHFDTKDKQYEITCNRKGDITKIYVDFIVNATYAYTNNVMETMHLEDDMTLYTLQHTEVVVLRTKKYVPSLTVMDGPYVSLMPYANPEPNLYLLYDVVNSIQEKYEGYYFFSGDDYMSNADKMIYNCHKYFPFELEYVSSLYGSRPIPINPSENKGDCRMTRIKCHKKYPGVYSILEGKFISAPLVADNIVSLINNEK